MTETSMPQRTNDGILQPLERPALLWLVKRMPNWMTPDILTGIGFIGACVAAAGYILSSRQPAFLWLATLGLLLNWFGDSLDGNLARFRKIERPRYGFFLDQNLDAFAQIIFTIGIGFSGFIRLELALLTLAAFFLLSILNLTRAVVANVFAISSGGLGPTEIRVCFAILNASIYFYPPQPISFAGCSFLYPEIISVAWVASMLIAFLVNLKSGLRTLDDKA